VVVAPAKSSSSARGAQIPPTSYLAGDTGSPTNFTAKLSHRLCGAGVCPIGERPARKVKLRLKLDYLIIQLRNHLRSDVEIIGPQMGPMLRVEFNLVMEDSDLLCADGLQLFKSVCRCGLASHGNPLSEDPELTTLRLWGHLSCDL